MGKVEEPGKMPSLLAAFSSKWARNVRNIRRVQSENPRCCCEKKSSHSELGGYWEEPTAPTGWATPTSWTWPGRAFPVWPFIVNVVNYSARQFTSINIQLLQSWRFTINLCCFLCDARCFIRFYECWKHALSDFNVGAFYFEETHFSVRCDFVRRP